MGENRAGSRARELSLVLDMIVLDHPHLILFALCLLFYKAYRCGRVIIQTAQDHDYKPLRKTQIRQGRSSRRCSLEAYGPSFVGTEVGRLGVEIYFEKGKLHSTADLRRANALSPVPQSSCCCSLHEFCDRACFEAGFDEFEGDCSPCQASHLREKQPRFTFGNAP